MSSKRYLPALRFPALTPFFDLVVGKPCPNGAEPGAEVVGLDADPEILERASSKVAEAGAASQLT
jgi:hypothetical protein